MSHLSFEQLCDYWAGDVDDLVESHLMGCDSCTWQSAQVAALTEALRMMIPPLLSTSTLAKLSARGLRILENPMQPGDRRDVLFPADVDLLIHRLGGLTLADVTRVDFRMRVEETGDVLAVVEDAPFDAASGSVMLACQQHYASLPPNVISELSLHHRDGSSSTAHYTILHRFERSL